jgi:signal transduction histidine kinase/DNA-binding response OmpR family regulator/CHASE3 domain sensor protein
MKVTPGQKIYAGVLVLMFALVVSAVLNAVHQQRQERSQAWVVHTYQVLGKLEEIISALKDAETGQRGYLLTGEEPFLAPYEESSRRIEPLLRELGQLTRDNPQRGLRIQGLSRDIEQRLSLLSNGIQIRRTEGADAAAALVKAGAGRKVMEKIRLNIDSMIDAERELLTIRTKQEQADAESVAFLSALLSGIAILALLLSALLLRNFFEGRQRAEEKLQLQYALAQTLNETDSLNDAIGRIHQSICAIGGWTVGCLWLVDKSDQVLECGHAWAIDRMSKSEFLEKTLAMKFKKGEGLPGRVWDTGKTVWIADVVADPNFPRAPYAKQAGLHGAFAFPVRFKGKFLGVCEFFGEEERSPDQQLNELVAAIGNQIGQFVVRQRTVAETQSQRAFLQLILDTISDGLVVANSEGRFILSNPAARELVGPLEDMPPELWPSHFGLFKDEEGTPCDAQEVPLARALRGENVDDYPLFIKSASVPGGNWISVNARPLKDDVIMGGHDGAGGGVVVFRDISEKREAEKRVSEFYSTVSHELRTPLTSIRGSLGLIEGGLTGPISEKTSKLIKIALAESDRLIRLINDILDLRKIEAGMFELKKTRVCSRQLVERTLSSIQGMAQVARVRLASRFNIDGVMDCDEDRTTQVLTNLLSNAIKFAPADSEVLVSVDPGKNGFLRFSVSDSGPGIPEEQMHKLFGKFQQIDQSDTRKMEGTGLGLAITKAIVEQHGGSIAVDSVVGKGTTFWFEMPCRFEQVDSTVGPLPETDESHVRPALLIEDDDSIAAVLEAHIVQDGFHVVRANTLARARALLEQCRPLVIILDLNLPDGDGLDLLPILSADEDKRDTPVVIVTGCDEHGASRFAHPALIDWIKKPFDEARLHAALRFAKQRIGPAQVLIVEDDPSTREVLKQQLDILNVKCIEAVNGAQALAASSENPDLIILDLSIPPPDGFAVVDALRKSKLGMTPLIVYTASDLTEEQKSRLKLGLTAHLTKSATTQEQLVGMVREFLNGLMLREVDAGGGAGVPPP